MALLLCEATTVALQTAVLVGTVDLSVAEVLAAQFAIAGLIKMAIAGAIAALLFLRGARAPVPLLLGLALVELAAATLTTHAVARLDDRAPLLVVEWLHQFGAAIWIGGIPCFLLALRRVEGGAAWRLVGARFSRMSMAGVACILASGATMFWFYIGNLQGFYGTAYGVMVGAKIAMFLMLLALGGMNFLLVERLRADPATPVTRLRRFAEVEIGIGVSIFFAAASLTSVPPAVDLTQDRVSWHEIVERNTPEWPRLSSPDHDALALAGIAGEAGCRGGASQRGTARWRSCRAPATCRRAMRPTSPGRNTTIIGPDCSSWRSGCWRWGNVPGCAGRGTGRCCSSAWGCFCSSAPIRRPGRWAISASWRVFATWRCCSTASSCC